MSNSVNTHIEITPGVCGGKPRIAGHRIRVQDIALWHDFQGLSPEKIVGRFPQLSLAKVHAALAYYFDHRRQNPAGDSGGPAVRQKAEGGRADQPRFKAHRNGCVW